MDAYRDAVSKPANWNLIVILIAANGNWVSMGEIVSRWPWSRSNRTPDGEEATVRRNYSEILHQCDRNGIPRIIEKKKNLYRLIPMSSRLEQYRTQIRTLHIRIQQKDNTITNLRERLDTSNATINTKTTENDRLVNRNVDLLQENCELRTELEKVRERMDELSCVVDAVCDLGQRARGTLDT